MSSAATEPSSPETESVAASSAPAPSLRLRPSSRASLRAASDDALALGLAAPPRGPWRAAPRGRRARLTARLVLGVEALLAGVEPGDPGLEGGEVALGALGAGDGLLAGLAQPADLVVGGGGAGLAAR